MYDPFVLINMVLDALNYAEEAKDPAGIQRARALLNLELPPAIKQYGIEQCQTILVGIATEAKLLDEELLV